MELDLTLNVEHIKRSESLNFYKFKSNLSAIKDSIQRENAHAIFLGLEAEEEFLPYFMNEPKTVFGFIFQFIMYYIVPKLFSSESTKLTLKNVIERLSEDIEYRNQTYSEYNNSVRPYSLVRDVNLVDLIYAGNDKKAISELEKIRAVSETRARPSHDRITLGFIYILNQQYDPEEYFKAEDGVKGIAKRNAQSIYTGTGIGELFQERVFRALLDYGQYFEDRYKYLKEITPQIPKIKT